MRGNIRLEYISRGESYIVAIVNVLPGKENTVTIHSTPERYNHLTGGGKAQKFVVNELLIEVPAREIPNYVSLNFDPNHKLKLLIQGIVRHKNGFSYIDQGGYCNYSIKLKNGKVSGYITRDSHEAKNKKQIMTIREFRDYFQRVNEEFNNKKMPEKSKKETTAKKIKKHNQSSKESIKYKKSKRKGTIYLMNLAEPASE